MTEIGPHWFHVLFFFFSFVAESLLAKKEVAAHTRWAQKWPTGMGQVTTAGGRAAFNADQCGELEGFFSWARKSR